MNKSIQQVQPSIEEERTIDLAKHFSFVYDNRWLIVGIALVATVLGMAYALISTPVYKVNLLIKVEDSTKRTTNNVLGEVSNANGAALDIKTAVASEMEILRSRSVLSGAVDSGKLYLNVQPKYFPVIGEWIARRNRKISEPGLFGYGGYVWGKDQVNVSVFNVPEELEGHKFILTVEGKDRFRLSQEELGVEAEGRTEVPLKIKAGSGEIELQVGGITANSGAQFFLTRTARLEAIEGLQAALKITEKGKQSGIIDVSLEGSDPKMTSYILNQVGREYIRQNVAQKSAEAEKTLSFLNTHLPELKQELEQSEAKYNELRNKKGTVDLGEEAKSVLQQSVLTQTRMVELRQRKEALLIRYEPSHPLVQAIDQQMRDLQREMASVEAKTRRLPDVEQNVLRLSRDVKINTELYTALLSAAQQLRLATESNIGSVSLLDTATPPSKPIKPKRTIIVALSGLMGLLLGVFAAFGRKAFYRRIDSPYEIEQLLGLPVAATIPHSQEQLRLQHDKKTSVLPLDVPTDGTVESLRRFRTSLQFAMLNAKNNIIMITGPTLGVGKSFVSANFATVLASVGKSVLLIDGDLRSGHLHHYFGLDRKNGLSQILTGTTLFGQAIHKNVAENVDFISTGELPSKPTELLASENFEKLLQLLSARYDFILIDTAPVLAVSDALVIASHAGAIFNIVRGGVSTAGEVEEAVRRLNQAGHTVTGVVFNDSKARSARYEYGIYRYIDV